MVAAIYKEGSLMIERKFQIIYDVEDDVAGRPAYRWVDLETRELSDYAYDTAGRAEEAYQRMLLDG